MCMCVCMCMCMCARASVPAQNPDIRPRNKGINKHCSKGMGIKMQLRRVQGSAPSPPSPTTRALCCCIYTRAVPHDDATAG